jgi:hypothetical protein
VIRRTRPQIVFLDVEMPELNGLQVVADLDPAEMPALVFVTAYSQYATRAFDVQALDYIIWSSRSRTPGSSRPSRAQNGASGNIVWASSPESCRPCRRSWNATTVAIARTEPATART